MILRWKTLNRPGGTRHFLTVAYAIIEIDEILFWLTAENGFKAGTQDGTLKRSGVFDFRIYDAGQLIGSLD